MVTKRKMRETIRAECPAGEQAANYDVYKHLVSGPNEGAYQTCNLNKRTFIRVFKDSLPANIWQAYCSGLGIHDNGKIKSFKVFINEDKTYEIDKYDGNGNLIDK